MLFTFFRPELVSSPYYNSFNIVWLVLVLLARTECLRSRIMQKQNNCNFNTKLIFLMKILGVKDDERQSTL